LRSKYNFESTFAHMKNANKATKRRHFIINKF